MPALKGIGSAVEQDRPTHVSPYAELSIRALAKQGLGDKISLGGAFGLLHYWNYRSTHDVDAWWQPETTAADRQQVINLLIETLSAYGQVRERSWGEVVSIELRTEGKTVFSFQIAARSAQLQPSVPARWADVLLDSLPDLLASKMVALVERGAPRDFRDIYTVCQAGLSTPDICWQLWQQRQQASRSDPDIVRARLAIEVHLERIEQHRPLARILDAEQRVEAQQTREWYRTEFLHARMD
jgi:hypothetical protein